MKRKREEKHRGERDNNRVTKRQGEQTTMQTEGQQQTLSCLFIQEGITTGDNKWKAIKGGKTKEKWKMLLADNVALR